MKSGEAVQMDQVLIDSAEVSTLFSELWSADNRRLIVHYSIVRLMGFAVICGCRSVAI